MIIRFPRNCQFKCPYFHSWGMSIDDYTCPCDLLDKQVDECSMDLDWYLCLLPDDVVEEK